MEKRCVSIWILQFVYRNFAVRNRNSQPYTAAESTTTYIF